MQHDPVPGTTVRMRIVSTDRFSLEPQTIVHAAEMFAVLSDPAIYQYENQPPPSVAWLTERFRRLESRQSSDGSEQWLNWVIRLPGAQLVGYVQATITADGRAAIAYILHSAYWGRGLARRAVQAMIAELADHHQVRRFSAVLKRENHRSSGLLERLSFKAATPAQRAEFCADADELAYALECAEDLLE